MAADSGHDGHVGHEVGNSAEIIPKHPVSKTRSLVEVLPQKTFNLLIFHKNKVEGAVECCVNQVCQTEIEDEDVRDTSHLFVV